LEFIDLKANKRSTAGKGPARSLRREGYIPAVLYGPDSEAVSLSVLKQDLVLALKDSVVGQLLLNLDIAEETQGKRSAIIKEMQIDPKSRNILHIDFMEISMNRKIKVMVPVTTAGKSSGVEMGGMLQIIRRELEVECFPNDIPESIEIDISEMDIGSSIHVEDIPLKEGFEIPHDVDFTVLTILSPKVEEVEIEEEEDLEEAEGAEAAEGESESTAE
jgi:large subunit ribosomal protein L25